MELETKLSSLKDNLREILALHESRCLWLSGGADSQLLLRAMLEFKVSFGILRFDDGWSKKQRQITDAIIINHNLQVFSYPPQTYLLIGNESEISLIAYYAVEGSRSVPVIRDLVAGDRCGIELELRTANISSAPIEFEAHIWGTRFDDAHYSFENAPLLQKENWTVGSKQFFAPLARWSKPEVIAALKIYGVDYQTPEESADTGNLAACTNCLRFEKAFCPKAGKEIDGVKWNKNENLKMFQNSLQS